MRLADRLYKYPAGFCHINSLFEDIKQI